MAGPLHRLLALILLVLALVSCGRRQESSVATLWPSEPAVCLAALRQETVSFASWAGAPASGGCAVPAPLEVRATTATMTPVLRTSCPMILAWARFEPEMQRLAQRRLGSAIAQIHHYGSHSCRAMTGNSRRPSLHSTAQAFDIAGFTTADGRYVSVLDDWRAWSAEGRFLRDLGEAACLHFNVVLTPAHDRAHRDHIHVDIGPWKLCGA